MNEHQLATRTLTTLEVIEPPPDDMPHIDIERWFRLFVDTANTYLGKPVTVLLADAQARSDAGCDIFGVYAAEYSDLVAICDMIQQRQPPPLIVQTIQAALDTHCRRYNPEGMDNSNIADVVWRTRLKYDRQE